MIWCFPHFFFPTVYHNWYFSTLRFTYFALVFTFPTLRLINANASHCNLPARIICLFFTGWRVWHCSIFDPRAAVPDSCTEWPSLHSEVGRPSVHLSGLQATLYGWGRVVTTLLRPASHPLPPPPTPHSLAFTQIQIPQRPILLAFHWIFWTHSVAAPPLYCLWALGHAMQQKKGTRSVTKKKKKKKDAESVRYPWCSLLRSIYSPANYRLPGTMSQTQQRSEAAEDNSSLESHKQIAVILNAAPPPPSDNQPPPHPRPPPCCCTAL